MIYCAKRRKEERHSSARLKAAVSWRVFYDAEVLAILLRTGVHGTHVLALAEQILTQTGGLAGLVRCDVPTLAAMHGIGLAKATTIVAAVELARRMALAQRAQRPHIGCSEDIAQRANAAFGHAAQEHVGVVCLNAAGDVVHWSVVHKGTVDRVVVRVADLLRAAVVYHAVSVALAHNHPSGSLHASQADLDLTQQFLHGAGALGITVCDHIIVAQGQWISLRDHPALRDRWALRANDAVR